MSSASAVSALVHALGVIANQYDFATAGIEGAVEGFTSGDWLYRPAQCAGYPESTCSHSYWNLGHIAAYRRALLRVAGLSDLPVESWEAGFKFDTKPGNDLSPIAPAALLARCLEDGKLL